MARVLQPARQVFNDALQAIYGLPAGHRRRTPALYLLGLKWSDIDLERGYFRVQHSLDALYGPPTENDPKRAASRRPAVLLPPVVAALKAYSKRQAPPGASTATPSPRASALHRGATTCSRGPSNR